MTLDIEAQVKDIVRACAHEHTRTIGLDSSFSYDLKYDELNAVELIMAIEEAFDVQISDSSAEKIETVGDLVALVRSLKQPNAGKPLVLFKKYHRTPPLQDIGGCPSISVKWIGINTIVLILATCFLGFSQVRDFIDILEISILAVATVTLYLLKKSIRGGIYMTHPEKIERSVTINISGGQLGNLNLGEIVGDVQANLHAVADQGGDLVAECLKTLTEAIVNSRELDEKVKADALEQVKEISGQAATPPEKRNRGVLKAVLSTLGYTLSGVKDIVNSWEAAKQVLIELFGSM